MVLRLRISSSRLPLGLTTITSSPSFFVEQGASDWARRRDFSGCHVGFFACNQLVLHLFILGVIKNLDGGTKAHFVVGDVVHVDHGQIGEPLAELADARLDELLALLGHVVFGVLAEVAEGSGLLDFLRKLVNQLVFERVDFFLQFSFDCVCHEITAGLQSLYAGLWALGFGFGPGDMG